MSKRNLSERKCRFILSHRKLESLVWKIDFISSIANDYILYAVTSELYTLIKCKRSVINQNVHTNYFKR